MLRFAMERRKDESYCHIQHDRPVGRRTLGPPGHGQRSGDEVFGSTGSAWPWGVFTPEDAFVAAANTCVMMMFIWATERFKLKLLSYECRTEGTKLIELDRTETFTRLLFRPVIRIAAAGEPQATIEARTRRALQAAQKYSLVANSVKSEILLEPEIFIEE